MLLLSASIEVRQAAAQCVKNILATQSGVDFWEQRKDNRDPMLAYLNPFRKAKKKVNGVFLSKHLFDKPIGIHIQIFRTKITTLFLVTLFWFWSDSLHQSTSDVKI